MWMFIKLTLKVPVDKVSLWQTMIRKVASRTFTNTPFALNLCGLIANVDVSTESNRFRRLPGTGGIARRFLSLIPGI
jgi:hypothetical protein